MEDKNRPESGGCVKQPERNEDQPKRVPFDRSANLPAGSDGPARLWATGERGTPYAATSAWITDCMQLTEDEVLFFAAAFAELAAIIRQERADAVPMTPEDAFRILAEARRQIEAGEPPPEWRDLRQPPEPKRAELTIGLSLDGKLCYHHRWFDSVRGYGAGHSGVKPAPPGSAGLRAMLALLPALQQYVHALEEEIGRLAPKPPEADVGPLRIPLAVKMLAAEEAWWHPSRPTEHIDREGKVDWKKLEETVLTTRQKTEEAARIRYEQEHPWSEEHPWSVFKPALDAAIKESMLRLQDSKAAEKCDGPPFGAPGPELDRAMAAWKLRHPSEPIAPPKAENRTLFELAAEALQLAQTTIGNEIACAEQSSRLKLPANHEPHNVGAHLRLLRAASDLIGEARTRLRDST